MANVYSLYYPLYYFSFGISPTSLLMVVAYISFDSFTISYFGSCFSISLSLSAFSSIIIRRTLHNAKASRMQWRLYRAVSSHLGANDEDRGQVVKFPDKMAVFRAAFIASYCEEFSKLHTHIYIIYMYMLKAFQTLNFPCRIFPCDIKSFLYIRQIIWVESYSRISVMILKIQGFRLVFD